MFVLKYVCIKICLFLNKNKQKKTTDRPTDPAVRRRLEVGCFLLFFVAFFASGCCLLLFVAYCCLLLLFVAFCCLLLLFVPFVLLVVVFWCFLVNLFGTGASRCDLRACRFGYTSFAFF